MKTSLFHCGVSQCDLYQSAKSIYLIDIQSERQKIDGLDLFGRKWKLRNTAAAYS